MGNAKKQEIERAEKGKLKKGSVLNPNGRPKGAVNKTTKEIRQLYSDLLMKNFDKIQGDIDKLEPKDRLKILLELSKFVLPTLRSIEIPEEINKKELFLKVPEWLRPDNTEI